MNADWDSKFVPYMKGHVDGMGVSVLEQSPVKTTIAGDNQLFNSSYFLEFIPNID